jgi:type IV secretion system protein VirB9
MRSGTILGSILAGSLLIGCQPQPRVETIAEPLQQACKVPPPVYVEVPVPVPMPCQLKPDPLGDASPQRRGGKEKLVRANGPGGVNSVQEHPYMPGALYQAYVAVNNATTILLQPGEYFHQAVVGDKGKWTTSEIAAGSSAGNRGGIVVNCNEAGARSNLTIAASKRVYLIELHCTEKTYHAQVSWTYPEEGGVGMLKGVRPANLPQYPASAPVSADAPSPTQYAIKSNRQVAWLPRHVYDTGEQGRQTYIVFPPALGTTDAPVLYVRTTEGTQAVVNYRLKQGYWINDRIYNAEELQGKLSLGTPVTYYVMDQIADHLELRVGEKKPTVVKITRQLPGV